MTVVKNYENKPDATGTRIKVFPPATRKLSQIFREVNILFVCRNVIPFFQPWDGDINQLPFRPPPPRMGPSAAV